LTILIPATSNTPLLPLFLPGVPLLLALLALSYTLMTAPRPRQGHGLAFLSIAALAATVTFFISCRGGSQSGGSSTVGTPPATYAVTVNGSSGSLQHAVTITLIVQ
jgi:hypothetical protein